MTIHTMNGDYDIDEFNNEYTVQLNGDEIVFPTIKDAKIAILEDIHNSIWKDNPIEYKKMYDNDDLNMMVSYIKDDKTRYTYFCKYLDNSTDSRAIRAVLDEGWYEAFMKYDSDVMDQFIILYEKISNKEIIMEKADDLLRVEEF